VHSVEPEGFDDYARSLRSGVREKNPSSSGSICDALLTLQPGEMTFAMNKERLAEGYVVSEAEVRRAVRFAFETLKLVVEPGGAAGLAAVLSGKVATKGRNIGIILSGGNVDPELFAEILTETYAAASEDFSSIRGISPASLAGRRMMTTRCFGSAGGCGAKLAVVSCIGAIGAGFSGSEAMKSSSGIAVAGTR
jgi:threonine dehydratase